MTQWLVIGISGVTCGGKTTLAKNLMEYFQKQRGSQFCNTQYTIGKVRLFSQDDYFLPTDDLRHKWNDKLNAINFELITSLDMKQMLHDITWTIGGQYLNASSLEDVGYFNEIPIYAHFNQWKPANNVRNVRICLPKSQSINGQILYRPPASLCNQLSSTQSTNTIHNSSHTKLNILIIEGFMIFNQPELLSLCNIKFHIHLPYEKCFERRQQRAYDPPDVIGYFEICVWPHYEKNLMDYYDKPGITILNGETAKERIFQFVFMKIGKFLKDRFLLKSIVPQSLLEISNKTCNDTKIKTSQKAQK